MTMLILDQCFLPNFLASTRVVEQETSIISHLVLESVICKVPLSYIPALVDAVCLDGNKSEHLNVILAYDFRNKYSVTSKIAALCRKSMESA